MSITLASNNFTKTGHTFNGWDLGSAGSSYTWTPAVDSAATKTATAQWTATSYSLTKSSTSNGSFVLSSSSSGTPTITTAQYGSTVYVKTTPNSGYEVNAVTTSPSTTVTTVTASSVYSFTMPANGVSVCVSFELAGIPTKSHVNLYTMSELQEISADIRTNGTDSQYYSTFNAFAESGENVTVTLHDGTTTKNATLVDASAGYGLVFMLDKIDTAVVNSTATNAGGWTSSELRTSLRSGGTLYNQYLDGMTMNLADATAQTVVPASVTTYSADRNRGSATQQTTTGDTFFLASAKEVYGGTATGNIANRGTNYENSAHQFAYFKKLEVTGSSYSALSSSNGFSKAVGPTGSTWWLRSAFTTQQYSFWAVKSEGNPSYGDASYDRGVLPCFCL